MAENLRSIVVTGASRGIGRAIAQQECTDVLSVLEQALHDSELSVRMMAVDSLGTDERSIFLLEQAKDDEEEAIRELAAMKLESLPNTGKH